jgi:hypothetical protein
MTLKRVLAVTGVASILTLSALGGGTQARASSLAGGLPAVQLTATSSTGGDVLSFQPIFTANPDGSFSAADTQTLPSFRLGFELTVAADPMISGSFTLTNLSATTQFFSVSATLGVSPVAGPTRIGGFFGDTTYTDANGDSNVTLATNGVDPFYRAQIDGVTIQSLGSFNQNAFGGPGVFGTISQEAFGVPIPSGVGPGVAASIGVSFPAFSLTPGDSVQVPFEFVVVPEPAFASLFATGSALILLASARRKFFHRA